MAFSALIAEPGGEADIIRPRQSGGSDRPVLIADLGGGIYRVTHPLPFALDHVHCYAIEDADGAWTIIDCGLGTPGAEGRWRQALDELGASHVARIVITHHHPDHLGASAVLAELTGAEVVQGRLDAAVTRRVWGPPRDLTTFERYLCELGMPPELAAAATANEHAVPVRAAEPSRLVDEGDRIDLAGEPFRILVLPGHAEGHIALLGERTGRLFGGDVLLAGITPNIGRWNALSDDPLGAYFRTLDRIAELQPAIVFPGHREPVTDAAGRAREIRQHHRIRLDQHVRALHDGAQTPYEVSLQVWGDGLSPSDQRFALTEASAHLVRLAREGRAGESPSGRWRAP